jgi:hypothetical protein
MGENVGESSPIPLLTSPLKGEEPVTEAEHFSLPFKGRVGVGMGENVVEFSPIPLLTSPLKGEEPVTAAEHFSADPKTVRSGASD